MTKKQQQQAIHKKIIAMDLDPEILQQLEKLKGRGDLSKSNITPSDLRLKKCTIRIGSMVFAKRMNESPILD